MKNILSYFFSVTFIGALFIASVANAAPKSYWTEEAPTITKVPGLDADQIDQLFTNLAEVMSPSVVNIYATSKITAGGRGQQWGGRGQGQGQGNGFGGGGEMDPDEFFRFFFGNPFGGGGPFNIPAERESKALGSGFIINNDGYIITNAHVVRPVGKNADSVRVKFIGEKRGDGMEATIVGVDSSTEVALLKVKNLPKNLKVASLGDSDRLKVGNWVIAIGNPYGHAHTVTQGMISALGRNIPEINAEFIQTSASINPGNSGGPLINLKGQVIGINTAIDPRAQGIGFAIPINTAKNVVRQLIEKGEVSRGWLGIGISNLSPELAEQLGVKEDDGALVQHIEDGQPADKAGLKVYDVVTEVNGKLVLNANELMSNIGSVPIGQTVKLKVIREGKAKEIVATVAKRPDDENVAKVEIAKGKGGNARGGIDVTGKTGLVLVELSEEMRRKLGIPSQVKGVYVEKVLPYSVGASAQIREGDVISEINRKVVTTVKSAEKELEISLKKEKKLLIKIVTNMGSRIVLLDLK
ncbi:MAG: trypsin-like peptidase domain-containing protein [Pseudomonadota bacterium]|nr:trypsin-like peptidase domain-containing protein [Pseudomonadota bacterium]